MSAAPRAVVVLLILGAIAGWWAVGKFNAERIESLTIQRNGYKDELDRLQPVKPVLAIDLHCEPRLMPAAPTYNERLSVYLVSRGDQDGRMLAGTWGSKAEEGLPSSIRCDLINRGNVPVANTWLDIDVVFKAVIQEPGRSGSGDIVGNHQRTFIVPGVVEVGGQPQSFWIRNSTDLYVFATIRERVMASLPDGPTPSFNVTRRGSAIDLRPQQR